MKRFILSIFIMCGCMLSLCGCSMGKTVAGSEKVEALRDEASKYNSARYFITNTDTDVLEQVFSFYFESSGKQVYLCDGVNDGQHYAEYNNGTEVFRLEDGASILVSSDDATYAVYTRKNPHPYSTGQLFFYVKNYIATAEETTDADGNVTYKYVYDIEAINKALDYNLSAFDTAYTFAPDGSFVRFIQHNVSAATEGDTETPQSYTYEITVNEINSVTQIENPVTEGLSDSE